MISPKEVNLNNVLIVKTGLKKMKVVIILLADAVIIFVIFAEKELMERL